MCRLPLMREDTTSTKYPTCVLTDHCVDVVGYTNQTYHASLTWIQAYKRPAGRLV